MGVREVPSDHDFFDPTYVQKWSDSIVRCRPERQRLFKVFAAETARIKKDRLSVFELGCGPGFLAEALIKNCAISRYMLLDFSPHMLELSRKRLAPFADRTDFIQRDFKKKNWTAALPTNFDLIVSLQAVHELRHASRIPKLYAQLYDLLVPGGSLLALRSRQFAFAVRLSSKSFHDRGGTCFDVQAGRFRPFERDLRCF